ncbi:hypothetical protein TNCV_3368031 [Trichonephila clavipes]|nr:hypothetical protein TNCV_3368031 [Trichonephila clavipes]
MGYEDELTLEELQEILYEEHQEIQRNVHPSEQEEDKRGPMLTFSIKDLLKKSRQSTIVPILNARHRAARLTWTRE